MDLSDWERAEYEVSVQASQEYDEGLRIDGYILTEYQYDNHYK